MALVVFQQLLGTREIQAMRQQRQLARIGRHRVFLPVVHQLQRVFDRPQEDIPVGQPAVLVGGQDFGIGQPHQSIQRVGRADMARRRTVNQLQRLHDEFDIADRTGPQLDLAPVATAAAQFGLDAVLRPAHGGQHVARRARIDQRIGPLQKLGADRHVPRHDPRLQQRLLLPQFGVRLDVLQIRRNGRDQFTGPTPRPQPHIDPIEKSFRRRVLHCLDQALRQRQHFGRLPIGQKHEVNVRTVVELLAAELAESEHRQRRRIDLQFARGEDQAGLDQAAGQQTQLNRRSPQVNQSEQVAGADPQDLIPLKPAQRVQLCQRSDRRFRRRHRVVEKLFAALQVGELPVLNQLAQAVGIAEQRFCQVAAADEQADQHFNRARVVAEEPEQCAAVGDALHEPLEVAESGRGVGRVGKQGDQLEETPGRLFRLSVGPRQRTNPLGDRRRVAKPEQRQMFQHRTERRFIAQQQLAQRVQHSEPGSTRFAASRFRNPDFLSVTSFQI